MFSKFAFGAALLGVQAMDLSAGLYEKEFIKEDELTNEFMSFDQRMRHEEEWAKANLNEPADGLAEPFNITKHHHKRHPRVQAVTSNELCTYSVTRLKKGPPTVKKIIDAGTAWTDTTFTGTDTLYWDVGDTAAKKSTFDTKLADSSANGLSFQRWPSIYPNAKLFKDTNSPHYTEPNQGGAGTCYMIQALAGVAEFPKLITDIFLKTTKNTAGIHPLKFYIRGKPWVLVVDDQLVFYNGNDSNGNRMAYFTKDATYSTFWAPILEKAWAKIVGNYAQANGGFIITGTRVLTGVPGFYYSASTLGEKGQNGQPDKPTLDEAFDLLKAGEAANYIMAAGTDGSGNDQVTNSCGIAMSHAYSILAAFTMTDANNNVKKMLLMRNPWGTTGYSAGWKHDDAAWTDALVAQVPLSVDPRTSKDKGIFAVEMSRFGPQSDTANNCFGDFSISHYRNGAGYSNDWFDQNSAVDSEEVFYEVTAPAKSGDLYFSVESYPYNVVPSGSTCFGGSYTFQGTTYTSQTKPTVFFAIYKNNAVNWLSYTWHAFQFTRPLMVAEADYAANDKFKLKVNFYFVGSATREYTVHVYSKQSLKVYKEGTTTTSIEHMDGQSPSGFTDNLYWGIDALCDPKAAAGTTNACTTTTDNKDNKDTTTDDNKNKTDTNTTDTNTDNTKTDTTVTPKPPADTPTGKTDDEILTGPPPATADALINNFNQLFDSDPGAAIGYLFDNFDVLFKFW